MSFHGQPRALAPLRLGGGSRSLSVRHPLPVMLSPVPRPRGSVPLAPFVAGRPRVRQAPSLTCGPLSREGGQDGARGRGAMGPRAAVRAPPALPLLPLSLTSFNFVEAESAPR